MRLLEYEAKSLLRSYSIPIPHGNVIFDITSSPIEKLPLVLKSQVPVGGRGKNGGVVVVETQNAIEKVKKRLFSLPIQGYMPSSLLAEEKLSIAKEHYACLLIDRTTATIRLIAHRNGGIEVEEENSKDFLNIPINDDTVETCSRQLAEYLGHTKSLINPFLTRLYNAFVKTDAILLEINPLVYTTNKELVCGDCKMELDNAAAFRHPEWNFEEMIHDTNFVVLDKKGTVATIANGAGLAMATVDAVVTSGMKPANFLDIGGGATTESIVGALTRIMEFENIQVIIINIFAGITRCDEVANAIIEAKKHIIALPPLCIRLAGTNFEKAATLLATENIPTLATLEACLSTAKEVIHAS